MKKTIDFSKYSSIKIGGIREVEIISSIQDLPKNTHIIGGCNNILLSPTPKKLAILGREFDFLHIKDNFLHIGGATKSGKILSFAKKHDLANFELTQKLPGTMGGMLKMNAGLKQWEIFEHLVKIRTSQGWIEKKDIEHGYRYAKVNGIIYEGVFRIQKGFNHGLLEDFKKMRDKQPQHPSCGSCFKNPKGQYAGKLIEEANLKGYRIGDMAISQKHANFLVNLGKGTFEDALKLIDLVKTRVYEKFGVNLEEEIIII